MIDKINFKVQREFGFSVANVEAIAKLNITQRAIVLERLMRHGRVDKRSQTLIKAYIADHKVDFSREECDHIVWGMGHLLEADDADQDSITGALIMMKYCIDGCCDEYRDRFMHKMVFEEL